MPNEDWLQLFLNPDVMHHLWYLYGVPRKLHTLWRWSKPVVVVVMHHHERRMKAWASKGIQLRRIFVNFRVVNQDLRVVVYNKTLNRH